MSASHETIRTLWSTDRKSRVEIFRRTDGTYGFREELYSDDEFEQCWIPRFGHTEPFCATEDIALREATSRVPWLAEMIASFEEIDGIAKPSPNAAPPQIDNSRVLCVNVLDRRHQHTGNCVHLRNGNSQGPTTCLAICQYDADEGYYLFSCDEKWNVLSDTYHLSLDEAKRQAAFEHAGTSGTWEDIA